MSRAPRDLHTVWQNEYSKLIDNRNYDNCRMRILSWWVTDKLLGVTYPFQNYSAEAVQRVSPRSRAHLSCIEGLDALADAVASMSLLAE